MSLPNAESYNEKISDPSDSIERSAYCLCELPRGYPITKKHFFITTSSVRVLGPERLIPFPFVLQNPYGRLSAGENAESHLIP